MMHASTETRTATEWGAELTWPDGHVEVRTHDRIAGQPYQRRDAELSVRANNDRDSDLPKVTARLVSRAVTTLPWTSADPPGGFPADAEWGVEITWPDGHIVTRASDDRRYAESSAEYHGDADHLPKVDTRVVFRAVITSDWAPLDAVADH